jgi:hypothetical protein
MSRKRGKDIPIYIPLPLSIIGPHFIFMGLYIYKYHYIYKYI